MHGMVFAYMGPPDAKPDFMNLDTLSWNVGAHALKFGVDYRELRPRSLERPHQRHDVGDIAQRGQPQQADRSRRGGGVTYP